MPLFKDPFSLEISTKLGNLNVIFFVNNNLYVNNWEANSSPHCHHDFEIRYVDSGTCMQVINKEFYAVESFHFLLIHPQEYHHQSSNNDSSQYNFRFSVNPPHGSSPIMKKAYRTCLEILSLLRYLYDRTGAIRYYLERLTREIYEKDGGYSDSARSLCTLIFVELLRLSEKELDSIFPPENFRYRNSNRNKVDNFFREKYLTDVKIGDLASDMQISERQVNRFLKKMYGMSFTRKLTDMRLEKAASLLIETNLPITEIIARCGFNSTPYFYERFREKFEMTPKEYQEKRQKAKEEQKDPDTPPQNS